MEDLESRIKDLEKNLLQQQKDSQDFSQIWSRTSGKIEGEFNERCEKIESRIKELEKGDLTHEKDHNNIYMLLLKNNATLERTKSALIETMGVLKRFVHVAKLYSHSKENLSEWNEMCESFKTELSKLEASFDEKKPKRNEHHV